MDELLQDFLAETGEHLEAAGAHLVRFEQNPTDTGDIGSIFRLVHTIKGTCGFIGLPRLERLAHSAESLVSQLRDGVPSTQETVSLVLETVDRIKYILAELAVHAVEPTGNDEDLIAEIAAAAGDDDQQASEAAATIPAEAQAADEVSPRTSAGPRSVPRPTAPQVNSPKHHDSVRVSVTLLETLMTLVSELVLTRNQLSETTDRSDEPSTKVALGRLSSLLSDLQDSVMRARMQPLDRLFGSLPRLARELGRELDKPIELVLSGADTELDRQLVEVIRDPLTHLVRNCADHGLESSAERVAAGKPEFGTIQVAASHESGTVVIRVSDDGRGLDVARIRAKVLALGLASAQELDRLNDSDVCRFIFSAGFSTAASVTNVSGRGMGMDIARRNIEAVGGSIELATTEGRGTSFSLKIPLTLAIAPALIVEIGTERFAVPQNSVTEIVELTQGSAARVDRIGEALLLRLRQDIVPVCDLRRTLALEAGAPPPDLRHAVLMRVGSFRFGVIVDRVFGTQEIVVKPLMSILGSLDLYSGNTILGDGSVVLILDATGLARRLAPRQNQQGSVAAIAPETEAKQRDPVPLILFRAGPGAIKALPLTVITRIEMIPFGAIERLDGQFVTSYGGCMMPLVSAGPDDLVPATGEFPILVIGVGGEPMGIVVSEIIDIVTAPLSIEISSRSPGLVGSARIMGHAVEFLDIMFFMQRARPEAFARGHSRRGRVLLVEDRPFFRDMLAPSVIAAGYDVVVTSGGSRGAGDHAPKRAVRRGGDRHGHAWDERLRSGGRVEVGVPVFGDPGPGLGGGDRARGPLRGRSGRNARRGGQVRPGGPRRRPQRRARRRKASNPSRSSIACCPGRLRDIFGPHGSRAAIVDRHGRHRNLRIADRAGADDLSHRRGHAGAARPPLGSRTRQSARRHHTGFQLASLPWVQDRSTRPSGSLAVGLELGTEAFALLVDDVGDVIALSSDQELPLPPHVSDARVGLTRAVYRLPGSIIAVLDVSALASLPAPASPSVPLAATASPSLASAA